MNRLLVLMAAIAIVVGRATSGHALGDQFATVSITSISGNAGHAFVYAQVTDSLTAVPAPFGTSYESPYYSIWRSFALQNPDCPYVWAVYVYDKATNTQVNPSPPSAPSPNFHTTTVICSTPASTPVGSPRLDLAKARLDLDLTVTLSPQSPPAGAPATLTAVLSSALSRDLGLYLSMAIQDWTVDRWAVDFGDGKTLTTSDEHGSLLSLTHVYASAGSYAPRVTAFISGHAQAAAYDGFGNPFLITRGFTVEISNTTNALLTRAPVVAYVAPQVVAAASPVIAGSGIRPGPDAFRHVEALRGVLTDFYIRISILREGFLTRDGVPAGGAHSTLSRWQYTGPPTDAPAAAGALHASRPADQPLSLQWNRPNPLIGGHAQDYSVPLSLQVLTVYVDGHRETFLVQTSFTVTIDFAAQNG